jgi:exonuclease SbcD
MKIIHTADWHLGQSFFDYDRKEEHLIFLSWLKEQIQKHSIDLLLIAGDIFDSPNPSADSQKIYYHFLRDVTEENKNLQIIITAGNHDSAARLEAPSPLLEQFNISVKGVIGRLEDGSIDLASLIVPITAGGTCLAVPYIRHGDYPSAEIYADGVSKLYKELYDYAKDRETPLIAMGHLQATGSEISVNDRSERTIIGGLEAISPESFAKDIAYVALGHLHRAQRVSGRDNIRYSGAPLPMSFAEKNNIQGVNLITIEKTTTIDRLIFEAPVRLISLPDKPKPLEEVLALIEELPDGEISNTSPFLEIKIHLTEPEPSLRFKIEEALKTKAVRLTRITSDTTRKAEGQTITTYEELQTINPLTIAVDIFKNRYGGDDMPENMKSLLEKVIREIDNN